MPSEVCQFCKRNGKNNLAIFQTRMCQCVEPKHNHMTPSPQSISPTRKKHEKNECSLLRVTMTNIPVVHAEFYEFDS